MNANVRIPFTCIHCDNTLGVLAAGADRTLSCHNPLCRPPIAVGLPESGGPARGDPDMPANGATTTSNEVATGIMTAALALVTAASLSPR